MNDGLTYFQKEHIVLMDLKEKKNPISTSVVKRL